MPIFIPIIIGAAAAAAAGTGAVNGIRGGIKMKNAKDTMEFADSWHRKNLENFEKQNAITISTMDALGKKELKILKSFESFSDVFEQIHGRPQFAEYSIGDVEIPEYDGEKLKEVAVGAGVLLGGLSGAAAGTASGFAAAGATTSAVMVVGTASTGTAIASLSGAAAVNATLAAIGGGAIAAGGGGIALGTVILSGATFGVALLVGGIVFSITGSALSKQADEAFNQMKEADAQIRIICDYLADLKDAATRFKSMLAKVEKAYKEHLAQLKKIVIDEKKTSWQRFNKKEKTITENSALLVGLLYEMCKVQMVIASDNETDPNSLNSEEIDVMVTSAEKFLHSRDLV